MEKNNMLKNLFVKNRKGSAQASVINSKIKSIKCIEVRKFYDSTWDIELKNGETCRIVRDDLETEENLRSIIEKCDGADEIVAVLDMRNKIYYD
jgi:hypothetical protein